MKPFEWHPGARGELEQAAEYYERERKGLGANFRRDLEIALECIQQDPKAFPLHDDIETRECSFRRYPYTIYYLELEASIWIKAVAHQHRKPDYRAGRAKD
jgi:toxin ParE1/3/4